MCPTPAIESKIQQLLADLEQAQAEGNDGYAEELNYELDELCNAAEQGEF